MYFTSLTFSIPHVLYSIVMQPLFETFVFSLSWYHFLLSTKQKVMKLQIVMNKSMNMMNWFSDTVKQLFDEYFHLHRITATPFIKQLSSIYFYVCLFYLNCKFLFPGHFDRLIYHFAIDVHTFCIRIHFIRIFRMKLANKVRLS